MKRSNPRTLPVVPLALSLALAFTLAGLQPAAAQESGSWTVDERVVPPPAGASEQLQAASRQCLRPALPRRSSRRRRATNSGW